MALLYTLDASILVSACRPAERGHGDARALMDALQHHATPLVEPTLLIVEIAAALGHSGTRAELALELTQSLTQLPRMTLVHLDTRMGQQAAKLAATHQLRGADAVYAAVALLYGAHLVTLDKEQARRHPQTLSVLSPAEARARLLA